MNNFVKVKKVVRKWITSVDLLIGNITRICVLTHVVTHVIILLHFKEILLSYLLSFALNLWFRMDYIM